MSNVVGWVVEPDGTYYLDRLEETNTMKVYLRRTADNDEQPACYLLGESFFLEENEADALRAAKYNLHRKITELGTSIITINFRLNALHEPTE
jgi:hypothetical protein